MNPMMTLGTIVTAVSLILCLIMAGDKERSPIGWFFGGTFLGGVGLIILSCLK
ncbi:MAG: hypothetical protein KBS76_08025 [Ruminococcus sp.]|nr:hypothetical protein [Candidatus Apopatosoma intestinale]